MELLFAVTLPDALFAELTRAAQECAVTPTVFAAQAVECVLASRRLPSVAVGRCGPRLLGDSPAEPPLNEPEEDYTEEYVEPPLVDDVESLADTQ